ncbi:MAG: hypothetical protein JO151_04230 [Verrucomicrobia bacterium]|nr:hypothetical protein [Verrucomicrobiota bacterium]
MPYELIKGTDPLKIQEQEYASGPKIMFTAFTSCVGVIAKEGGTLTGVHLVMVDKNDEYFGADARDVPLVISKLPKSADKITIFGWLEDWRSSPNQTVKKAFAQLTGTLKEKNVGLYHQSMREDGTYGAEIGNAGEIKITF